MKGIRRLFALSVITLLLAACQDNVIVQDPPAPPPPPPPPGVDATVSILGLDLIPAGTANPTAIAGDINVQLNIEEGDNTVTAVDLLFDGAPLGCATINTNTVPGEGVSLSTAGGADVVECFWNTDDFAGTCDGSNLPPAFGNGTHTLGAEITLDDGTKRTASNTQQVTLVNSDLLTLVMLPGAQSVVSGGVTFHGGPRDLDGDGTDDNPVDLAVCPVSFGGTTVASVDLGFSSTGVTSGGMADIGSGPGATETDAAEPFVWTVDPADNDRASGNLTESNSAGGPGNGHDFLTSGSGGVAGTILDDTGLNVTSQFAAAGIADVHLDFVSPLPGAGSELTVGGSSTVVAPFGQYYSPGNTFAATGVTDMGVGFTFGPGSGSQVDIGDCTVADNFDNDPATAFTALFPDVTDADEADEDDWSVGDDGGPLPRGPDSGVDCYVAEVVNLQDDLGNVTDLVAIGAPDGAINTGAGGGAVSWGVDITPPTLIVLVPDTDPADSPVLVLNPDANADGGTCADAGDCTLEFEADDPDLLSGDPGSQIAKIGCDPCTNPTATDEDATGWPVSQITGNMFEVDISLQPDGPYTITIDFSDRALPGNAAVDDFTYDLDDTAPAYGALNPAPVGSAGTDAVAIVMTIGGTISDVHIIDTAVLSVFDNVAGVCGDGDDVLLAVGSSANQVDQNAVDLTDGTGAITFNQSFTIQQPSAAAVTINYCFVIDAEDEAVLKDGTDSGNMSSLSSIVAVTWNAG